MIYLFYVFPANLQVVIVVCFEGKNHDWLEGIGRETVAFDAECPHSCGGEVPVGLGSGGVVLIADVGMNLEVGSIAFRADMGKSYPVWISCSIAVLQWRCAVGDGAAGWVRPAEVISVRSRETSDN